MSCCSWMSRGQARTFIASRRAQFDEAARSNPFAHSAFQLHSLEQVATDEWRILAIESGSGDEKAVMLLYAQNEGRRDLRALTNYYASLFSPVVSARPPSALAVQQLVAALGAVRPTIATVDLAPIAADDVGNRLLLDAMRANRWYVRPYFCFGNWYMPCARMDFETYMRARDSRTINTWQRKEKRFRSGTDGARLEIVTDPKDVGRAMDAYETVYRKSWKGPEPYADFVRGWAGLAAERGWLRLGLAWHNDLPIAAQFWFVMNERAYIFKLAYDEAYSKWSAGTVLSALMFKQALDTDRVHEIDYLTGDDSYKRHWVSMRRERTGIIACNMLSASGLWRATYEWAGAARKRFAARGSEADSAPADGTLAS